MARGASSVARLVRSGDMFGYTINLNFNRKGHSHKTIFGGIVTLFVHAAIFTYIFIHLKKMLLMEDNKNYTETNAADLLEKGLVDYGETRLLVYAVVRDQINGRVFIDDEDFQRSLSITFVDRYVSFYEPETTRFKDKVFQARPCRQSDFGPDDQDKYIFSTWASFTIVCPDVPEGERLELEGDLSTMTSRRLLMQVAKCDNSTREGKLPCFPEEQMTAYLSRIQIDMWAYYESIDYGRYEGRPTFKTTDLQIQWLLTPALTQHVILQLREHQIETQDSFFTVGSELSFEGNFYQVGKIDERPWLPYKYPGLLFQADMILMAQYVRHQREIYNLLDLLGDLGGVYEIVTLVLGVYVLPISRHSFVLKAVKKLYRGRTKDSSLFKIDKKHPVPTAYDANPRLAKEREKNRRIRVRFWDSLRLYFSNTCFKACCCKSIWPNKLKFQKLFRIGERRIEKELDVIKIMRNLKDIKICLRHSIMTDKIKQEIAHTNKKVIDLDDTGQCSSEVEEDTLDQDLQFSSIQRTQMVPSSSEEHDETIFTSGSVQRNIQRSMFKIKLQKAKRRAEQLEKIDQRGEKMNHTVHKAAFEPRARRIRLTREQAAVVIGRWWRRMLMRKFRLGQVLDPVLEFRIEEALNKVRKETELAIENLQWDAKKGSHSVRAQQSGGKQSSNFESPGGLELANLQMRQSQLESQVSVSLESQPAQTTKKRRKKKKQ